MTLISSHLFRAFALQVSDRLVVNPVSGNPTQFDALSNKNIVYWARDAIVSISYTGPAYIGSLTTDNWIAQKLTGVDVSEKFGMRGFPLSHWLDIGQSSTLLLQELAKSEIARLKPNFELVAVGWQWKKARRPWQGRYQPVPMAWALNKPEAGRFGKEVERLPRHWHWKNSTFFNASPRRDFPKVESVQMFNRLRAEGPSKTVAEAAAKVERATVDTIRSISHSNPYVGANCMSVLIEPPHQSTLIRISFLPDVPHNAQLLSQATPMILPAAFSPWIVGGGWMHKPSVQVGQ